MAKNTKKRTHEVRLKLTGEAYRILCQAAGANCREPWQEATYRLERDLVKAKTQAPTPFGAPTDTPAPVEPALFDAPSVPIVDDVVWPEQQEQEVYATGRAAGMSDGQVTALRLIKKTPEAVLAAIGEEAEVKA